MPESVRDYQQAEGAPYEGPLGHTLQRPIHVTLPSGAVRSVRVYVQINVATDLELREPALAGTLHQAVLKGARLALPYVFHDPVSRRFALVLPESLRHRELFERARLLSELAEATHHPIPPYVRQARVVIGPEELRFYLDSPAQAHVHAHAEDLRRREHALLRAAEELAERESRLRKRAEEITRREDEFRTSSGSYPPADDVEDSAESLVDGTYVLDDEVEELVDDADVQAIDEASSLPREETDISAVVSAPANLIDDPDAQMVVVQLEDDHVELAARLDLDHESNLTEAELLCQWVPIDSHPVVLLTLVQEGDPSGYARRCPLDPSDPEGRRALRTLKNGYRARVDLFSDEGALIRTLKLGSKRSGNVTLMLEKIQRDGPPKGALADAFDRALGSPPPTHDKECPFSRVFSDEVPSAANSWQEARNQLLMFAEWSEVERLEYALLTLSIPSDWVERCLSQVIRDALSFGLVPPPPLEGRAILSAPEANPEWLIERIGSGLLRTLEEREQLGVSITELLEQWEALNALAAKHDVAVKGQLAQAFEERLAGASPQSQPEPSGDDTENLSDGSLIRLLSDPESAFEAATVLLHRGDPSNLEAVLFALEHMHHEEVLKVAPLLAARANEGVNAWRKGLRAGPKVVRHMSLLLVEASESETPVQELEALLEEEPSDLWKEIARVLGKAGNASYETIATRLPDSPKAVERLGYALAHLAANGLEEEVQELTRSTNSNVALAALEAIRLLPDAANHQEQVKLQGAVSDGSLGSEEPLDPAQLALSRAFWLDAEASRDQIER